MIGRRDKKDAELFALGAAMSRKADAVSTADLPSSDNANSSRRGKIAVCQHCGRPLGEARLVVHDPEGLSGEFHVDACYEQARKLFARDTTLDRVAAAVDTHSDAARRALEALTGASDVSKS